MQMMHLQNQPMFNYQGQMDDNGTYMMHPHMQSHHMMSMNQQQLHHPQFMMNGS
jgi:hypothetical protein